MNSSRLLFPALLGLSFVGPAAAAKGDSSSASLYEYLASKGFEVWRKEDGGFIQMQTFSCNSVFLKDVKVQMNKCWYSAAKNSCRSDEILQENDGAVAKNLYEAMAKMGLLLLSHSDASEDWRQIDADYLSCAMTIERSTAPVSKSYSCWAMKKLKN